MAHEDQNNLVARQQALVNAANITFPGYLQSNHMEQFKRLGLYICTNYKNGSDLQMCVDAEDLILPEEYHLG